MNKIYVDSGDEHFVLTALDAVEEILEGEDEKETDFKSKNKCLLNVNVQGNAILKSENVDGETSGGPSEIVDDEEDEAPSELIDSIETKRDESADDGDTSRQLASMLQSGGYKKKHG